MKCPALGKGFDLYGIVLTVHKIDWVDRSVTMFGCFDNLNQNIEDEALYKNP